MVARVMLFETRVRLSLSFADEDEERRETKHGHTPVFMCSSKSPQVRLLADSDTRASLDVMHVMVFVAL